MNDIVTLQRSTTSKMSMGMKPMPMTKSTPETHQMLRKVLLLLPDRSNIPSGPGMQFCKATKMKDFLAHTLNSRAPACNNRKMTGNGFGRATLFVQHPTIHLGVAAEQPQ